MKENPYPKKFTPHHFQKKDWFYSVEGKPILPRKKGVGFIVFDSLDGAGNSTQVGLLKNYLEKEKKKRVLLTKEPTSSLIGGLIRSQLAHEWKSCSECLQLLFSADRAHHLEKEVIPFLKKGIFVISDRYFFSTIAYGNLEIKDWQWLKKINKKFLLPDLVFFLKVSPKICIERIKKNRFGISLFEKEKILAKVWKNYEKLAREFKNVYIVNGEREIKKVGQEIREIVEEKLKI